MLVYLFRITALVCCLLATSAFAQTITLQNGVNGYAGTTDSWMIGAAPDQNRGTDGLSLRDEATDSAMIRFAIFAAEGGPVPNGANITSATLSLYKFGGPDAVIKASRLLKNWNESQVTWNIAASGVPWTTPGALSAGNDYVATADGQASIGDATANACDVSPSAPQPPACWLNIDVTAGVRAFAGGAANYGWKLAQVSSSTSGNYKNFDSKDLVAFPAMWPKLTITYDTTLACNAGASRPYDQAPVSGNPIAIAASGTTAFEAEYFNCGGEGQGYHDTTTTNNSGQTFRATEGVEIIAAPSGLAVNQFDIGEWMAYSINVAGSGTYDLGIFASSSPSGGGTGAFHIEIDGVDVTGSVSVPVTTGWDDYQWVTKTGVSISAGPHVLKLVSLGTYFRTDQLRFVAVAAPVACNTGTSRPYNGTPVNNNAIAIPSGGATFEAEHFNCGGEGQGYHDITATNNSGQTFRATEGVEITAAPSGLAVNQFDIGEWMAYSINVAQSGTYDLGIFASSSPTSGGPGAYRIEVDGADVTGNVTVPLTTGWDDYQWVNKTGVALNAGSHILKLVSVGTYFRTDRLHILPTVTPPPPPPQGCGSSNLCIDFEADTQFSGDQVRLSSLGTTITATAQNKNNDSATDTNRIALVSPGRDGPGTFALKLQTLDNDSDVHSSGDRERSEIEFQRSDIGAAQGVEQWWAHSVYLPSTSVWPTDIGTGILFFQFHTGNGGQPAFEMEFYNLPGGTNRRVIRAYSSGANGFDPNDHVGTQYESSINGNGPYAGTCIHDNPQTDVWIDFLHHVKFSSDNTGYHEVWLRENGGPVKKVLDKHNINMLWTSSDTIYLKMGSYQNPVPGNTAVIHDRLRRGTSAAAISDFNIASAPLVACANVSVYPGSP